MDHPAHHKLLERQLRRVYGGTPPPEVRPLLAAVDAAYRQADDDRALVERSLDLSSRELCERNERLRAELEARTRAQEALERELAQRRQTEEELRRTMVRLDEAQRVAKLGYWEWTVDDSAAFWSDETYRIFGYEPGAVAPTYALFAGHLHPDDLPALAEAFVGAAPFESNHVSFRITRHDGVRRTVRATGELVYADGRPHGLFGVLLDVTEQEERERALVEAREHAEAARARAEEMLRLKSSFLNNMSHELRTPLTGILGFASVIEEEAGDDLREFAAAIGRCGRRLQGTFNSVLELAQLESGPPDLDLRAVDVGAEVDEALAVLRPLADEKALALRADVPAAPCLARANPDAFHRVLVNLVGNAVKFTDRGGVTVEARTEGDVVVVRVTDTGVGIGADFVPHLFDEFRQESEGLDRRYEGNGLGLAIAGQLVERMGGTIAVESEVGVGSVFSVRLPAAVAARPGRPAGPGVGLTASAVGPGA